MRINIGTLMFNMDIEDEGGTPSWGTDLGQSKINNYKFDYDDIDNVIKSLAYCSVPLDNVDIVLGKGGSRQEDYEKVLAGLFSKVQVNKMPVPDAKFVFLIIKQMNSKSGKHIGRKTLKYSKNMTYNSKAINEDCIEKIRNTLGLSDKSAWFVRSLDFIEQDTLNFNVEICDKTNPMLFANTQERKEYVENLEKKNRNENFLVAKNIIYYGIPGCGKSFCLKQKYGKDDKYVERVVFHPDYSYSDFVGQILPVSRDDENGNRHIDYKFVPGPFTRILKKAEFDICNNYYLIIEEINRGNAPAIFGDIFQLLDRKTENDVKINGGSVGESVYAINNPEIAEIVYEDSDVPIRIPDNMFVVASMNTSDQNVFTLDTAFKRRWDMKNIINNWSECKFADCYIANSLDVTWYDFVKTINEQIIDVNINSGEIGNEDKRIGAFFISEDELTDVDKFSEKVLMYLWNDAFKFHHSKIFKSNCKTLESLIIEFKKVGLDIFNFEFYKTGYSNQIYAEQKVPQLAYKIIESLAEMNLLTEDDIENLQNKDYCSKTFKEMTCQYIAKNRDDNKTSSDKIHYNAKPININNTNYYVSYEWYEDINREPLLKWYKEKINI